MSEVVVQVVLDSTGAVTGAKRASRAVSSIGDDGDRVTGTFQRMGTAIKSAFAFVFAGVLARGLKDLAQKAFDLGTAVEETASKFSAVFGPAAAKLDAELRKSANAMGLTQTEARGLAATVGAVVQGMGVGQQASADYAAEILKLGGDINSFSNAQGGAEQVTQAITSAIVGEREALKTLGIVILEEDVKQRQAQRAAEGHADALTKQGKVAATLELITERAGVAVGDLDRTQDSAANRARKFSAELREQADLMAQSLLPTMAFALDLVNDLADGTDGARYAFVRFVADGVFETVVSLTEFIVAAVNAGQAVLGVVSAINVFSSSTETSRGVIGRWTDDLKGLRGWIEAISIGYWGAIFALSKFTEVSNDLLGQDDAAEASRRNQQFAKDRIQAIQDELKADNRAAGRRRALAAQRREELEELLGKLGELGTDSEAAKARLASLLDDINTGNLDKLKKSAEDAAFALREMQVESMADGAEKVAATVDLAFDQREAQLRARYADLGGLTEEMEAALGSARVSAMSAALDALVEMPDIEPIRMPPIDFEQVTFSAEIAVGEVEALFRAGLLDSIREVDTAVGQLGEAFETVSTDAERAEIQALIDKLQDLREQMVALSDEEEFAAMMEGMNAVIEDGLAAAVGAFADGLGALAAGDADVQSIVGSIFGAFAGMLQRLGEIAIATGIGIKAIQTALASLNPLVAIGAGVALIALAATMRAAASDLAYSDGGSSSASSTGPSGSGRLGTTGRYATPGSSIPGNPSTGDGAAAQPQVKVEVEVKGESRIAGDDIRTVYNKASERYGVTRG